MIGMIEHHASVVVPATADRVFALFSRFEEFPRILGHVRQVTRSTGGSSHWVVNLMGRHEWDARDENWIENRQIGWNSIRGLRNRGLIRFLETDSRHTRVDLHIWYDPPSGTLGDVGELLGAGNALEREMQRDLERLATAVADRDSGKEAPMSDSNAIERVSPSEIDTTTMPILDVRTHPRKEQIRGALRYDPKAILAEEHLTIPLPHEGRIVVYADSEDQAERVAERLREQGYAQAAVLDGGFDAYRAAGLPTEEITQEQPVPGHESAGIPRL